MSVGKAYIHIISALNKTGTRKVLHTVSGQAFDFSRVAVGQR